MKKLSVLCIALCVSLSATAAVARGGMGSHMSVTGGAFGTSAAAPGTFVVRCRQWSDERTPAWHQSCHRP
jgi:hypothetical protein